MSGKYFEAIKQLFPRSRAFELSADNSKRGFFKGLSELPEDIRKEAELAYLDLFPETTRFPDKWERVFALLFTEDEKEKRGDILDSMWKAFAGGQSTSFLEMMLQRIDPRMRVVENIPAGNPRNPGIVVLSVCGHYTMRCGHRRAVCRHRLGNEGFLPTIIKNDATTEYNIPESGAYWENCFFVCASAIRDRHQNILFVEPLKISGVWKNYVEYITLKVKPAHTTAIIFIDWVQCGAALPPLTGTVAITGKAVVGETLAADVSAVGGSGGLSFRWQRGRLGEWGDIAGAAGSTYEVQPGDVCHYIRVTVARRFFEGEVASDPVGPISDSVTCTQFDLGMQAGLAVKQDGSLWAWGSNGFGQLGDGTTADRYVPTRIDTDTDWAYVSAGTRYTVAIRTDGSLWAWGFNGDGRTGLGATAGNTLMPAQVGTDTDWAYVSAGHSHTIAIKTDGSLWSWGVNEMGVLGLGDTAGNTLVPTRVGTDTDWAYVAAGYFHTMAIKADGSLWAWGWAAWGRLGTGVSSWGSFADPMRVGFDNDWAYVSAGHSHTVAIKTDGSLWAWGFNGDDRLGDGTTTDRNVPTHIGTDNDWAYVSAGDSHTVATRRDGSLWAWGDNANGRTGLGVTTGNTPFPTRVGTDTDWAQAVARSVLSGATKTGGSLWAWGSNANGGTGLGVTAGNTPEPTRVG